MVGPALDDGRYFGALIAVGATQRPPRLVIDLQQWFTDQEAIAAAIEDGVVIEPRDDDPERLLHPERGPALAGTIEN